MSDVERVLSLDISSKTGWGVFDVEKGKEPKLVDYGVLDKTNLPSKSYPENYLEWAANTWAGIQSLIDRHKPHHIAVEETAIKVTGSNAYSQKFLDWCHYHLARFLVDAVPQYRYRYFKTDEWRKIVGCNRMTDADKKHNKFVRDIKAKLPDEYKKDDKGNFVLKKGKKVLKPKIAKHPETGKVISLVNKKTLNIRKANETFGLSLMVKDEDIADGILLGYAYCLDVLK